MQAAREEEWMASLMELDDPVSAYASSSLVGKRLLCIHVPRCYHRYLLKNLDTSILKGDRVQYFGVVTDARLLHACAVVSPEKPDGPWVLPSHSDSSR